MQSETIEIIKKDYSLIKFDMVPSWMNHIAARSAQPYNILGKDLDIQSSMSVASIEETFKLVKDKEEEKIVTTKNGEVRTRKVQTYVIDSEYKVIKPIPKTSKKEVSKAPAKKVKKTQNKIEINGVEMIEESSRPSVIFKATTDFKVLYGYLITRFGLETKNKKDTVLTHIVNEIGLSATLPILEDMQTIKANDPEKKLIKIFSTNALNVHEGGKTALQSLDFNLPEAIEKERLFSTFFARITSLLAIGRNFSDRATVFTVANFFEKICILVDNKEIIQLFKEYNDFNTAVVAPLKKKTTKKVVETVPQIEEPECAVTELGDEDD